MTWKSLIEANTDLTPFVEAGDDGTVVAMLNEKTIDAVRAVGRTEFMHWAAKTGIRADIEDAILDLDPAKKMLRSTALTLVDVARGGGDKGVDFSKAANIALLGLWLSSGKIDQAQHDELLVLATVKISLAEEGMGRDATIEDVARIRGQ